MRLLRLIAESDGSLAMSELAHQLGVTEALLEPMIEDLVRMGYLAPPPDCDHGACQHCPQRGGCSLPAATRLWTLTPRGRQAAQTSAA